MNPNTQFNHYISNTPGIWYAIAYVFSTFLFLSLNHNTRKKLRKWLPLTGISCVLILFMHLTSGGYGLTFILVMITVLCLIYLMFHLVLEGDFYKKAYFTVRAFMLGEFMASLGWQIYYFFSSYRISTRQLRYEILYIMSSFAGVLLIEFFLERRNTARNRELIITRRELVTVTILSLALYAASNLSYVIRGIPFTTSYTSEIYIIRTIIDLTAVSLLFLYHELLLNSIEKVEAETLKNMLEMQYAQYQISQENIDLVNQKYHDLKHQIVALKNNIHNENSDKYLDQMLDEIKHYETVYSTGNRILDTMLTSAAMKAQARNIEFTCVADGTCLHFMNPVDITALFGNALDNAIESAEKIPDQSRRLIHATVDRQKSFVRIHIENTYIGKIRFRHDLPLTSKADTNFHGFGTKSMKNTAEKYGGSIQARAEDGWFKLSILIPYSETDSSS